MRKIKSKYIAIAFVLLVLFSLCMVMCFFKWLLFFPAIIFLNAYMLIDRKYLRCPRCSGFTNLDRLSYAKTHIYHCSHCGEIIEIEA